MQFTSIISILAACASIVAAQDGTTTSTSTMTQTVTITHCNPSVTNCPGKLTTSTQAPYTTLTTTPSFPISNSTIPAGPTSYPNTTAVVVPSKSTSTQTVLATGSGKPTASSVTTSGAGALIARSGLLMGVLGAGIAILA